MSTNKTQKNVHKGSAIEIKDVDMFDNFTSTNDNWVILFYKPTCPYCIEFFPTYDYIASEIHRTNSNPDAVPIVMAEIDAEKFKDDINALRPDFLGDPYYQRGYPTILFKNAEKNYAITWNSEVERSFENIINFMGKFFEDPSLRILQTELYEVMDAKVNNNPEFFYFYDQVPLVPRFIEPLNENFINADRAQESLDLFFLENPDIANRGVAIPVNLLDRNDITVPLIYDNRTGNNYAYRDSHRFILQGGLD